MAFALLTGRFALLTWALVSLATSIQGETVTFDWEIGWTRGNPDGQFERPVIGINGQWPLPLLNITKGDRVVVNLDNQVGLRALVTYFVVDVLIIVAWQ